VAEAYARVDGSYYLRFSKLPDFPAAQADLGRRLFFDPRLSAGGTLSCAGCHQPARAWTDGRARARGAGGRTLARNTPTLLDLRGHTLFFWDGRAARLTDQVLIPVRSHAEMGQSLPDLIAGLRAVPAYERDFRAAFGGPATADRVARALTAFLYTLNTPADSPFDRGRTDPAALSPAARRGLVLFAGKGRCLLCHQGPMFTDHRFHNLGLKPRRGGADPGRWAVARVPGAFGAFLTPSLRNVARTAPYMHDGRFKTLAQVVSFYNRGGDSPGTGVYPLRPLGLSRRERKDLVAFLESLNSTLPAVAVPAPYPAAPGRAPAVAEADATPPPPAPAATDRPEPADAAAPPRGATTLADACRAGTVEALARALGAGGDDPRVQLLRGELYDQTVRVFVYRALAARSGAPCGALAGLSRGSAGILQSADYFCRDWYHELSFVRAAAEGGPGFGPACRAGLRWSYRDFDAADARAVCGAVAGHLDDPARLCAALTPRYLDPRQLGACEREYALLGGRAYACARGPRLLPEWNERRCEEYTLYRRARAARDPAVCGSHALCRALMGGAAAEADAVSRRVLAEACRRPESGS
jgi:cytochrome c peroxidase